MRRVTLLSCLLVMGLLHARFDAAADNKDETTKPYGLSKRIPWTTSRVVGTPEPPPPYRAQRAFPNLKIKGPTFIAQEPGTDRLVVAELEGKIVAFDKNQTDIDIDSVDLFLDVKRQVAAFSFHPNYEENGQIFVFSNVGPKVEGEPDPPPSRVFRFTTTKEHPRRVLSESEEIIIEWPSGGHNGGEAIIGPDGYLYISTGDGTGGSDPEGSGQGVDDLFAVMMRLDVENPDPGKGYSIPEDNPFVDYPGARPEIWAHGFRNPWRMSFDPETGWLWVGDVGQDLWEMIWVVERGGNYGWSVQEGSHPFHPYKKQGPGPILPPVVEHHHTESRSITGGYVYHGEKFPELEGVYVYGDYEYGNIWGVRYDGQQVTWSGKLADTVNRISSFGVSRDGEIYFVDYMAGELYTLERAPAGEANRKFPRKLSETGLFESTAEHRVAPGVIPFSVNTPVWSDGAVKERFFALPGTSTIKFVEKSGDANTWTFDDGTALLETISMDMESGNPASRRRIETRMTVKQENHWLGYTYLWNDEQTDATLVDAGGTDLVLPIKDGTAQNGLREQSWHVPSRNECMVCHSRAAGFVLGLNTLQMNKDHDYDGVVDNQLRALSHVGIFTEPIEKRPEEYGSLPNAYDGTAELEARARAYLHVNCAVCHVADGGGNARIKLLYTTATNDTDIIDAKPIQDTFELADARIIAPGDPYASVLFYRMSKLGRGRMPHVGATVPDEQALDLMHDWILTTGETAGGNGSDGSPLETEHAAALNTLRKDGNSSGAARAEAVEQLLSSVRGALLLARAFAKEELSETARQDVLAVAMNHGNVNVRDLFERFVPPSQRVKRLGDEIDLAGLLAMKGSAEAGRVAFFSGVASQCKNCHTIQGNGGDVGPDLSEIGKKYKPAEILENLLQPSIKIDEKFIPYVLVTVDGKVYNGILAEKNEKEIVLKILQESKSIQVRVPVDDIDEFAPQDKSIMPDFQLRDMTAQQAADLLAFLSALK